MTDPQVGKYRMYLIFATFLTNFAGLFKKLNLIKAGIQQFTTAHADLIALVPNESFVVNDSTVVTQTKADLFAAIKQSIWAMTKLASVWAELNKNTALMGTFGYKYSDIPASEPEFVAFAKAISTVLIKNKAVLEAEADIEATQITELASQITVFEGYIGKPAEIIIESSNMTTRVADAFDAVDSAKEQLVKSLEGRFGKGTPNYNKEFMQKLKKAIRITVPKRYTGIRLICKNKVTGASVADVEVDIPVLNKKMVGDKEGIAWFQSVKTTKAIAYLAHPDFEAASVPVKAEKGKTIDVVVFLVPKG